MAFLRGGIPYPTQYAYRQALAQKLGFSSVYEHRQAQAAQRARAALDALAFSERSARSRALDAVKRARNLKVSLSEAARLAGTTLESVKKHAAPALTKVGGRWQVKPSDRIPRQTTFLTPGGKESGILLSSREASLYGRYLNAVKEYQATGDPSSLKRLEGKWIRVDGKKRPLLTDPQEIDRLTRAGETDIAADEISF